MLKLSSMAVVVSDGKESARWYSEKLGLEVRDREGHWITVGSKDASVVIHLCEGDELEPGNTGIAFLSKDVTKEHKALEAKGVRFTRPVTKESWGTFAMFADPDGNEYWLYEE
jgi:catechol 2,3-dioxygenase-like lactoylglutathione lyase family enzyme